MESAIQNEPERKPSIDKSLLELSPDLTVEVLHACISSVYDTVMLSLNKNAPKNAPGTIRYIHMTQSLRDQLRPRGWSIGSSNNLESIVSPDESIKIVCTTGNIETGRLGDGPSVGRKGLATARAVGSSFGQNILPIFDSTEPDFWYLVFFVDEYMREIRCELSRPIIESLDDNRHVKVTGWSKRLILPPWSMNQNANPVPQAAPAPQIPVSLKSKAV